MENKASTIRSFDDEKTSSGGVPMFFFVLVVITMIAVGIYLGKMVGANGSYGGAGSMSAQAKKTENGMGIQDKKRFPDQAEGLLKEGGMDGEGNFHLERPGGASQSVYLTSSIVDLSQMVGQKVRVWGQTFTGQKAGWLMDVGYVEKL
jgi:hypothetical protein